MDWRKILKRLVKEEAEQILRGGGNRDYIGIWGRTLS